MTTFVTITKQQYDAMAQIAELRPALRKTVTYEMDTSRLVKQVNAKVKAKTKGRRTRKSPEGEPCWAGRKVTRSMMAWPKFREGSQLANVKEAIVTILKGHGPAAIQRGYLENQIGELLPEYNELQITKVISYFLKLGVLNKE